MYTATLYKIVNALEVEKKNIFYFIFTRFYTIYAHNVRRANPTTLLLNDTR